MSILPALQRIHELSGSLQAAAHHDGLLSDNGQGILQQPRLVLDGRRCGRHVGGLSMVCSSESRSRAYLLPLRASPERLHWYGVVCSKQWSECWTVVPSSWLLPTPAQPTPIDY